MDPIPFTSYPLDPPPALTPHPCTEWVLTYMPSGADPGIFKRGGGGSGAENYTLKRSKICRKQGGRPPGAPPPPKSTTAYESPDWANNVDKKWTKYNVNELGKCKNYNP